MAVLELSKVCWRRPEEARALVRRALRRSGGRLREAARELGVDGGYLAKALRHLGIPDEPQKQREAAERRFRLR
jgi:transcriptional regulator with GAF, ATPase, and Fis domain